MEGGRELSKEGRKGGREGGEVLSSVRAGRRERDGESKRTNLLREDHR